MTAADTLALYVHWPFCASRCPYCDFNSHVREGVDQQRWCAALLAEIDHWAERAGPRRLESIFFGGGTPSLMPPETAAAVIDAATRHWTAADNIEITLEANPSSVEAARFRDIRAAGVNRVSLGVQALDDDALRFLGRRHDLAEALDAVRLAAGTFPRFSFDLIYTRPGQTVAAWRGELRRALAMSGEHLSVYQLTIEKGTPFWAAHGRGDFALPDEDTQAALYETTQEMLTDAGLPAYEISNHARPGAECRHNLVYWTGGDYAGVGPGAHGRLTVAANAAVDPPSLSLPRQGGGNVAAIERLTSPSPLAGEGGGGGEERRLGAVATTVLAAENHTSPENWLAAAERHGHGARRADPLDAGTRVEELLMMGLRLTRGIDRAGFARRAGRPLDAVLDAARVKRLVDGGFLVSDMGSLRATPAGLQRLNAVLAALTG
jgi:oxygen-independent coproporphyrinogen-3 oxidase